MTPITSVFCGTDIFDTVFSEIFGITCEKLASELVLFFLRYGPFAVDCLLSFNSRVETVHDKIYMLTANKCNGDIYDVLCLAWSNELSNACKIYCKQVAAQFSLLIP